MLEQYLANLDAHSWLMMIGLWVIADDLIYVAIALSVASAVLTALTTKSSRTAAPDPSTIGDFDIPQVDEGTAQAVVFGDVWLPDWQVLWYGNLGTSAITTSSSGSKK